MSNTFEKFFFIKGKHSKAKYGINVLLKKTIPNKRPMEGAS